MYLLIRCRRKWGWLLPLLLVIGLIGAATHPATVSSDTVPADAVSLPVIMYHGLHPSPSRQGAYVIDPARLEEDLQWLNSHGYHSVTVAELITFTKGASLPEKPILLTFDDGYLNNHLYGTPLLQTYHCRAVLSPICAETVRYSALSDRHDAYAQVTWDDLREMIASGCWEIQNHSYAMHTLTPRKGSSRLKGETLAAYQTALQADIPRAQQLFTRELHTTPTAFVYPFGAIGEGELAILQDMGFLATFTCTEKNNLLTRDPHCLFELGRFRRPEKLSAEQFFTRTVGLA